MSFTIRLESPPQHFPCAAGQSVLSALVTVHQRRIRAGCHGGGCGVCKIRVRQGRYATGSMSTAHMSDSEAAERVALACRTYPLSDLCIEPWGDPSTRLARRLGFLPSQTTAFGPVAENTEN